MRTQAPETDSEVNPAGVSSLSISLSHYRGFPFLISFSLSFLLLLLLLLFSFIVKEYME